jgi:hypothetical protein
LTCSGVSSAHAVTPGKYTLFDGFAHLASGLSCGLAGLAAGMAIGIVGDAGVRWASLLLEHVWTAAHIHQSTRRTN